MSKTNADYLRLVPSQIIRRRTLYSANIPNTFASFRTPQEANGRTDFVALLTKRGGAQATLVAFDLLCSAGIRDVDCGDNSTASVDAKRAAIQSQARFTQLSCAGDATRSEKPPAAHRGRGFRFRISPLLCAILSLREDFKMVPRPAPRSARRSHR
jgi:hypothetical protein